MLAPLVRSSSRVRRTSRQSGVRDRVMLLVRGRAWGTVCASTRALSSETRTHHTNTEFVAEFYDLKPRKIYGCEPLS
jgi:hypothetical protein